MASKFLSLNEAAAHLGITPDRLSELRQNGTLYGYRDGATWKFKLDDLDRARDEIRASAAESSDDTGGSGVKITEDDFELKLDEPGGSSPGADSFELVLGDDAPEVGSPTSDLHVPSPEAKSGSSGVSDILAGVLDSSPKISGAGASDIIAGELLNPEGGTDKIKENPASDVLGGDAGPVLINPSESQLGAMAAGDTLVKKGSDLGDAAQSGISLETKDKPGSSVKLGDDDDIFGGGGSDVTLRPSDSGILLVDPGDSGLALDQPLNLAGGSGSAIGATSSFQLDDPAELKADDDFLLTPLEEPGDESSDSGSQVIVLDEGEPGHEPTATLMTSDIPELQAAFAGAESPFGITPSFAPTTSPAAAAAMVPMVRETPFSVVSILMLTLCVVSLSMCGVMMHDVMTNIWDWEGSNTFSSQILEMFRKR